MKKLNEQKGMSCTLNMIQMKKLNEQKWMSCELKEDTDEEAE